MGETAFKILMAMQNNPQIAAPEIAQETGVSSTGIENNIAKMLKKGYLIGKELQ